MLKEFREFAIKGSLLDMAIGIVLGAAFGQVVSTFVKNVIMPPFGLLLGRVDFASLYVNLSGKPYATLAAAQKAGAPVIAYGAFFNAAISFLIVAFTMFLVVRRVNRYRSAPAAPPPAPTKTCPYCCLSIALAATRCPHCTSELPAAPAAG